MWSFRVIPILAGFELAGLHLVETFAFCRESSAGGSFRGMQDCCGVFMYTVCAQDRQNDTLENTNLAKNGLLYNQC